MRPKTLVRRVWHNVLFAVLPEGWLDQTYTCREIVEYLDLGWSQLSLSEKARAWLHLSYCEACHNYFVFSTWVREEIKSASEDNDTSTK